MFLLVEAANQSIMRGAKNDARPKRSGLQLLMVTPLREEHIDFDCSVRPPRRDKSRLQYTY